jgi:hypothetical protein
LVVAGGFLTLTIGTVSVSAAGSSTAMTAPVPQSSSKPHKHERVECSPGFIAESHGQCVATFVDPKTKGEPHPQGQQVCFSVSPAKAGSISTGSGKCARIGSNDKAYAVFKDSGNFCGKAIISAVEPAEHEQPHHTTVTIVCPKSATDATTTAAMLPPGSPFPPAGGWLLGAMGVGVALVTGYAVRTRRRFSLRRLAAGQSA